MSFDSLIEKVSKWDTEIPEGYISQKQQIDNIMNCMFYNTPPSGKECWITINPIVVHDTTFLLSKMKKHGSFIDELFPCIRNNSMGWIIIEWTLSDGRVLEMISKFCRELKKTEWSLSTTGFYKRYTFHSKTQIVEDLYKILTTESSELYNYEFPRWPDD